MISSTQQSIQKIIFKDKCFLSFCRLCNYFFIFCFLFFFAYIIFKSGLGIWHYGIKKIFFTLEFNLSAANSGVSFWSPLAITLILALFVILITLPAAIKCAIWLTFTSPKKINSLFSFLIDLLSNLPSIIFGFFVRNYLSEFFKKFTGINNVLNIIFAIITLIFMILPTVITFLNHSFKKNMDLIQSSSALGINKKYSIYKLALPNMRKTIIIIVAIIFSRVVGESVALSFLLSGENYKTVLESGFFSIFTNKLSPIATLISDNFFSDGSQESGKNLLFAFGLLLLLFSLLINYLLMSLVKNDENKNSLSQKIKKILLIVKKIFIVWPLFAITKYIFKLSIQDKNYFNYITFSKIKNFFNHKIERLIFFNRKNFHCQYVTFNTYIQKKFQKLNNKKIFLIWHTFWEYLSIFCLMLFAISILSTLIIDGIKSFYYSPNSFFDVGKNSVFRALINTFVIIIISLTISLPITLFASAYLSEYQKNLKIKKCVLLLIHIACSSPTIIFGIFGLSFFIYKLGISSEGIRGKSLLAGILTTSLLIMPYLMRQFYNCFSNISKEYRQSAYSLGISKLTTFFNIVMLVQKEQIIAIILTSMGKILGETASLFLTAGLNSINTTNLMYPGQTLTTRIYSQFFNSQLSKGSNIVNETAFVILIVIILFTFILKVLLPCFNKIIIYSPKILFSYYLQIFKHKLALFKWYIFIKNSK